ncbi:MAG: hypothetical protein DRR19_15260 [Candidatus Parabeggiatoa sp. nov. 1]|nr:MAG: hypothetical protein DRR19_15260 [Gammaproteobacteria bacterium]
MTTSHHKPQVVILCEDVMHYHFARRYFQCRGFTRFIPKVCPKGRSSGEQYVREHYAQEVKAYRSKENYLNIVLVVIIDADKNRIDERISSLNESQQMVELNQHSRSDSEKIAIFVPARNIETWIHYLNGNDYNEEESYKSLYSKGTSPGKFAEKLAKQLCPQGLLENAPPSLHHACNELKRLEIN